MGYMWGTGDPALAAGLGAPGGDSSTATNVGTPPRLAPSKTPTSSLPCIPACRSGPGTVVEFLRMWDFNINAIQERGAVDERKFRRHDRGSRGQLAGDQRGCLDEVGNRRRGRRRQCRPVRGQGRPKAGPTNKLLPGITTAGIHARKGGFDYGEAAFSHCPAVHTAYAIIGPIPTVWIRQATMTIKKKRLWPRGTGSPGTCWSVRLSWALHPGPNAAPDVIDQPLPDAMQQDLHLLPRNPEVVLHGPFRQAVPMHHRLSGNSPIYYDGKRPGPRAGWMLPDCYVAFGVDAVGIYQRNGYFLEEVGHCPRTSPWKSRRSAPSPTTSAPSGDLYARLGIHRVLALRRQGRRVHYGERLVGETLAAGEYRRLARQLRRQRLPLGLHSPVLGLDLCWEPERLRFFNPRTRACTC